MNDEADLDTPLMHILLVEDSPADIRLAREVLGEVGLAHTLTEARDGLQALRAMRGEAEFSGVPRPDLVLLDLSLPGIDGHEVLRIAKQDPLLKTTPILIFSTSGAPSDVLACYRAHANCYVTKPVDLDEFMSFARVLRDFWLRLVRLPPLLHAGAA